MRSRYQGSYIDRYIHLFTYNIINYCLQGMRTCYTYNLIKGVTVVKHFFAIATHIKKAYLCQAYS